MYYPAGIWQYRRYLGREKSYVSASRIPFTNTFSFKFHIIVRNTICVIIGYQTNGPKFLVSKHDSRESIVNK